jgi:hypothetical protein
MGMQDAGENMNDFKGLEKGRIEGNHRGVNMRMILT